MKANCWIAPKVVRVEEVPDPQILSARDAIIKVTATTVCGSDLHLFNGKIPALIPGDILGHEAMGEVVEVGADAKGVSVGDRVVVPFCIACGACFFCQKALFSLCDNSNPHAGLAEKIMGFSPSGLFGYTQIFGGYAGSQAEYVRVPMADVNCFKVPQEIPDEQALFLTDIFPTGFMAAENCNIEPGDTVAVWGCGPVGQFAIVSAFVLGAERVIAIDRVPERLELASSQGAETIDFESEDVYERLRDMTGGRGPDACIDAVGMEAHGMGLMGVYDQIKQRTLLETDRPNVLRQAIRCCRKGGTLSIAGVYAGFSDKIPFGIAFNKGLTMRMGQTHVHRYIPRLTDLILRKRVDPSFVATHEMGLEDIPAVYRIFLEKQDGMMKAVIRPGRSAEGRGRGERDAQTIREPGHAQRVSGSRVAEGRLRDGAGSDRDAAEPLQERSGLPADRGEA